MAHLTPEQLLDLAEGTRSRDEFPHLRSCADCADQVAALGDAIAAAADVAVPEPSPLFWAHLSTRVRDRIAIEGHGRGELSWWTIPLSWRFGLSAVAVAALVVIAGIAVRQNPRQDASIIATTVEPSASGELSAFDADPALALLAELSSGIEWDTASEAGLVPSHGTADKVVFALSPEERLELQRILEEALAASGA